MRLNRLLILILNEITQNIYILESLNNYLIYLLILY